MKESAIHLQPTPVALHTLDTSQHYVRSSYKVHIIGPEIQHTTFHYRHRHHPFGIIRERDQQTGF